MKKSDRTLLRPKDQRQLLQASNSGGETHCESSFAIKNNEAMEVGCKRKILNEGNRDRESVENAEQCGCFGGATSGVGRVDCEGWKAECQPMVFKNKDKKLGLFDRFRILGRTGYNISVQVAKKGFWLVPTEKRMDTRTACVGRKPGE